MQDAIKSIMKTDAISKTTPIYVLHVDDDPSILEISTQLLMDMGNFEVDNACCVDEAFKKLSTNQYDIIVSDYEMPQKDGLQFLRELRSQNNEIPFILFTGKGREEVAIKALNLGVDGYYNKQGSPETVYGELCYGIIQTVDRKRAEEALRKSEHLNQKILNSNPNLIYIYDLIENRNVYANKEVLDFLGYTSEQVQAMGSELFANILHPDDAKVVAKHHARFANASDNEEYEVEYRMKHSSGEWRWFLSRDTLFACTKKGVGKQILGSAQDITEQRTATDKVRFESERLERVIENSQDLIMLTKPDGKVVYVNSALKQMTGYCETEFVGKNLWIVHPEDSNKAKEVFGCILKGENVEFEHRIITKDGQTKWVIHSGSPIIEAGKVIELVSTIRDITESKRNHDLLRMKEQELENILDSSPTIIFYKDLNGKFIQANKTFAHALNTTKDNLLGKTVFDIYSAKIAQDMTDDDNVVLKSKTPKLNIVEPYESATGLRWIRTHKIPTFDEKGEVTGLIGFSEEITDYKKAEDELKESLNDYHSLINGMSETAWVIDFAGNFLEVNDAAVNMLGYSKDELLSIGIAGIDKHLSRMQVQKLTNNLLSNKKQVFETIHTNKDGTGIPVEISSSLITYQGKQMILSIARNITERKVAEQEQKENSQKIQVMNDKLRVVGGLTRHDVGNKLAAIGFYEFLLRKSLGDKPELAKYLDGIKNAIDESSNLFELSGFYEKIEVEKLSNMDVFECFNVAAALFSNLITLKVVNECQGLKVVADSLLKQLFYNLIDNSLKHGEKVTQIRFHYAKEVNEIKLFYEDNGVGIPEANKCRLFEVGFTTGKGSGFGLYLIRKIIEVYGWTIQETGESGKGAKFAITIPKINSNEKENYYIKK